MKLLATILTIAVLVSIISLCKGDYMTFSLAVIAFFASAYLLKKKA